MKRYTPSKAPAATKATSRTSNTSRSTETRVSTNGFTPTSSLAQKQTPTGWGTVPVRLKTTTISSGGTSGHHTRSPVRKTSATTRGSYSRNADGGYEGGAHPPPPPPPPPPAPAPAPRPTPITPASAQPWLTVAPPALNRPRTGYILVSLAIYNGYPFKDHWAFFLRQSSSASNGILVHAEGNVRDGFIFEIKRNHDFAVTGNVPALIDLHWVDGRFFNQGMWNNGHHRVERPGVPTCPFELSVARAPAPRRSLNPVEERAPTPARPARIRQRNCQTWIVEAGAMLVQDQMIPEDVLEYLLAIKQ